ncbi:MAG: excinuclease ABC subunit UvrA [Anaerolineae bacterium]
MQEQLIIRGAREHNLKNIDVEIPRNKLVVITGLSGSGKSTLAFDTIFAEGQRRYVESLSAYARQFLGQMDKPDVDSIEGLSPAISIDQKGVSHNPRSTVGTVTEVYDYLRLLFARVGIPHCPICGRVISQQTPQQMVDDILNLPDGTRILLLAPLIRERKGHHQRVFEDVRKAGFVRVRVNGEMRDVNEDIELDRYKQHTIEAVVDRLIVRRGDDPQGGDDHRGRLTDSVETALKLGGGVMIVSVLSDTPEDRLYSEHFACPEHGTTIGEIEPRTFSFNTPHGACPTCQGLGTKLEIDPELIVPNPDLSLIEGAVAPWSRSDGDNEGYYAQLLAGVAEHYHFSVEKPWRELTEEQQKIVLYGSGGKTIRLNYRNRAGRQRMYDTTYEGVIPNLERRYGETDSDWVRSEIEEFMSSRPCPTCNGARLRPEALGVTVDDKNIVTVTQMSIREALPWVRRLRGSTPPAPPSTGGASRGGASATPSPLHLVTPAPSSENGYGPSPLSKRDSIIAEGILKEIDARLGFLVNVGLDYLTLDRRAGTLAGGEAQRIRLATQIGSQLMGVLYILDEPSIGLHQRDNTRLIQTMLRLRDVGNTVLVVEHDEETMRSADWIIDLGPGAGEHGGEVVAAGPLDDILHNPASLTGQYLSGEREITIPRRRRHGNGYALEVLGARENNLKNVDVRFPLGTLTCVTGVSGSGKSTLVLDVLYRAVAQKLYRSREKPGDFDGLRGLERLDKVIDIDQSPIGRTPRSNPATYTNLFNQIRDLFAGLPESKARGYKPGRFSFNVKGGRCEACQGDGIIKIEMQFLPDIYVPCEVCHGARYNRETLQITYKGKNIAEVLDMTVDEAIEFFDALPAVKRKLQTLSDVGLGYIHLGQSATTLSGGEAQRIKLAKELSRVATGNTLYILDEPTTGLHFEDVRKLLGVLQRLVDNGNTVLVIEHNLDVIKSADWIVDLGPEGGAGGGRVIAEGTPEEVAHAEGSHTGEFLRRVLDGRWQPERVTLEA